MASWTEFEVKGLKFRLKPLKVVDAEDLAQPLIELLGPAAAALLATGESYSQVSDAIQGLGRAIKQERLFREKFLAVCEWEDPNDGNPRWVKLDAFFDQVFSRNHTARYAWLRECITLEFGPFLVELGQDVISQLKAKLSIFLAGFAGGSTESQPADDTTTATEK